MSNHRYRSCTNPPPSNGGKICKGKDFVSEKCGQESCDAGMIDSSYYALNVQ